MPSHAKGNTRGHFCCSGRQEADREEILTNEWLAARDQARKWSVLRPRDKKVGQKMTSFQSPVEDGLLHSLNLSNNLDAMGNWWEGAKHVMLVGA